MTFEEFFKSKMEGDDFEGQFKEVVDEIIRDGLKVLKEVCEDTWKKAQKEKSEE